MKAKKTPKFKSEGQASAPSKKPFKKHAKTELNRCGSCGKSPSHARTNCPAKDATCHKCNMRGHWGAVCRSQKTVGEVEDDDYAFLGEIGSGSNGGFWSVDLRLNNSTVRFKIARDHNPGKKHLEKYYFNLTKQLKVLSLQEIIIGITALSCPLLNYLILIGKVYIWDCRRKCVRPYIEGFILKIKTKYQIEKYIATKNNDLEAFYKKWTGNFPLLV